MLNKLGVHSSLATCKPEYNAVCHDKHSLLTVFSSMRASVDWLKAPVLMSARLSEMRAMR